VVKETALIGCGVFLVVLQGGKDLETLVKKKGGGFNLGGGVKGDSNMELWGGVLNRTFGKSEKF